MKYDLKVLEEQAKIFPKAYMQLWAIHRKVDLKDLISAKRSILRQSLVCDLKTNFPKLSYIRIGELCNIHYVTVICALKSKKVYDQRRKTPSPLSDAQINQIQLLHNNGKTIVQISRELQLSYWFVQKIVSPEKYQRYMERRRQRRKAI